MIESYSKKYENDLQFSKTVNINLKTWTSAYMWARMNKKTEFISNNIKKISLIPGGEYDEVSLDNLQLEEIDDFDEYIKKKGSYYYLTLPVDDDKWKDGDCTCPMFLKNYMCKHLLGIAIQCKLVHPPPEAKNLEIGTKQKRGRKKKKKKAFIIQ